jgi:hypothetical protein
MDDTKCASHRFNNPRIIGKTVTNSHSTSSRVYSAAFAAGLCWALVSCASDPNSHKDPAVLAKEKHDAQMIKKMESYVGWNIGTFMSDWAMTPAETTMVPDGNVYRFEKLQASLKCTWEIRTNSMGNIVQWSMRGNACPDADGP